MASYQTRQRDPLLDQGMQAALERRGKELLGLGMIALAFAFAMLLGSYSATDTGWMAASDGPVTNWLGPTGAAIASTLMIILGLGAWGIPLIAAAWGLRFVLHRGTERALNRAIFSPIAVVLISVEASTMVPGTDWGHSFGLGGLFGDTVLGAILGIAPVHAMLGLKLISFAVAMVLVTMVLFVTGFDGQELRRLGRFLLISLIRAYAFALTLLSHGGRRAAGAARDWQDRRSAARDSAPPPAAAAGGGHSLTPRPLIVRDVPAGPAHMIEPPIHRGTAAEAEIAAPVAPRPSLLARMPSLIRRPPAPELVEPAPRPVSGELPSEERIKSRIASAISARRHAEVAPAPAAMPVPEGALPPRFRAPPAGTRVEPPVTARPRPEPPVAAELPPEPEAAFELAEDDDAPLILSHPLEAEEAEPPPPAMTFVAAPQPEPRRIVQQPAQRRATAPSRRAQEEAQPRLAFDEAPRSYEPPPLGLLANPSEIRRLELSEEALEENARMLETVLDDYGVKGEIVSVRPGPVVTMYELEPAPGLKASRVIGLADDIARSMSALSARVSTVPGRTVIGIELPNATREKVLLREILAARDFGDSNLRLPLALGKDIGGEPVIANLAKMPHLLIAGTTGSGKSVAINTMILSLLYKLSPDECRLIMIDPKMLELSVYDGIPHLLSPVVTDPKKAVVALKWVVGEMEERYRKMSRMGVRNIEGYNGRVREALSKGEMFRRTIQTGFDEETGDPVFETEEFAPVALPYIVVIVDEMADLMMVAGKEIEACIQRLAQMARASGIHLIMATQRPSVDVITGTIKANFPTRISFQVTSKIDSRTILGEQGAEQLLGMGDMLYMAGGSRITRVHGPFVSDEEVEEIVNHLKSWGPPEYMSGVLEGPDEEKADDIDLVLGLGGNTDSDDALYDQAVAVVLKDRKVSTSYIQRKLAIGYNKAARLVEQMEEQGLVSAANHVGKREILVPEQ